MHASIRVLSAAALVLASGAHAHESARPDAEAAHEGYVTTDDGVRVFYQAVGAGEQTVVVPNAVYLYDDFQRLARGRRLIAYDMRNRGRSDSVGDDAKLSRGVHQDVDDLEAIRRHFDLDQIDLIGHSYLGVVVALYAMQYPQHVHRMIQIGPAQPDFSKQYPANLTGADATSAEVFQKLGELQKAPPGGDPQERCRQVWSALRPMYVTNRSDVDKLNRWGFCDLPNERNMLQHFNANIIPTLKALKLSADQIGRASMPILVIHGRRDRSAPYGGGRDWAALLPNARLLTIDGAAHVPWIEAPERVFGGIDAFLKGGWPEGAERVEAPERTP
jgi:proline iminopeptidase